MTQVDIARAWKEAAYRTSLSDEERELLPGNPVGTVLDLVAVMAARKAKRPRRIPISRRINPLSKTCCVALVPERKTPKKPAKRSPAKTPSKKTPKRRAK